MKLSEAFPSKFLKASDLQGRDVPVTISKVEIEEFDRRGGGKENKLVLSFSGKAKSLVCNKTNAGAIAKVLGTDDTDHWIGRSITLVTREVDFEGETSLAIRVSLQPVAPQPQRAAARPAQPVVPLSQPMQPDPRQTPQPLQADPNYQHAPPQGDEVPF